MTVALLSLLLVAVAAAPQSPGTPRDPLARHRWTHRLLVVHVPDTEAGRKTLERFHEALDTRKADVVDRDLLIVPVDDLPHAANALRRSVELGTAERASVRQRLGIQAGDMQLVLLGKDGGVKDRQTDGFDLRRVFALIDGMPMRRLEAARQRR